MNYDDFTFNGIKIYIRNAYFELGKSNRLTFDIKIKIILIKINLNKIEKTFSQNKIVI